MKQTLHSRCETDSGFSLLEMLVAVAIVAIALVPLASLEVRAQRAQARLGEQLSTAQAQLGALDILRDANLTGMPTGSADLGVGYVMEWQAFPLTALTPTRLPDGAPGEFEVALYRVDVNIFRVRSSPGANERVAPISTFSVEQTGWRKRENADSRIRR